MSTTPRTDAARGFHDMDTAVSAEDMAQLETELIYLREENKLLKAAQKISEERDEQLIQEARSLQSLGAILTAYDVAVKTRNHLKTELEVMTARAEKAEAEVEQLTSRLYKGCDDERDMAISEGPWHGVCGLAEELTARAKKAEADTARLDWLDENMGYSGGGSGGTYTFFTPADVECGMLRDAIDAAIKESIEVPDPVSIEARNPTGGD